jgi:hypothetical protein
MKKPTRARKWVDSGVRPGQFRRVRGTSAMQISSASNGLEPAGACSTCGLSFSDMKRQRSSSEWPNASRSLCRGARRTKSHLHKWRIRDTSHNACESLMILLQSWVLVPTYTVAPLTGGNLTPEPLTGRPGVVMQQLAQRAKARCWKPQRKPHSRVVLYPAVHL